MSSTTEEMRMAWQRQALDAPRISLAYLCHQAQRLRRRTLIRNACEYLGALVALIWVIAAGWDFIHPRPLISIGIALWALGVVHGLFQWNRRASMPGAEGSWGTLDALQFYRQQLVRQRDARLRNWRWWLPPIVPGLVLLFVGLFVEVTPTPWFALGALAGGLAIAVTMGIVGYERAARGIQLEIEALDSMAAGGSQIAEK